MYPVSEANRTPHCVEIKAYDYMLRFEKSFNGFGTVGNVYDFLTLCCRACKVELAHTQAEIAAMPDGAELLSVYTAISSTNVKTQTAKYYALETDDGPTMNLGVNPLLKFGLDETRKVLLENILSDLPVIRYVPFDLDTIGNTDILTATQVHDAGQIGPSFLQYMDISNVRTPF